MCDVGVLVEESLYARESDICTYIIIKSCSNIGNQRRTDAIGWPIFIFE